MSFEYPICVSGLVDIDELLNKIQSDYKFINFCRKYFSNAEYDLVNFILHEGLMDIKGQEPADDPIIDDDPYNRPIIDNPNLDPENPDDEDPYARPSGWDPDNGVYYDPETGSLVDKEGNIIVPDVPELPKEDEEKPRPDDDYIFTTPDADIDNPNWKKWVEYCRLYHPDWYSVPHTPIDEDDPDYEGFMAYLNQQANDVPTIAPLGVLNEF